MALSKKQQGFIDAYLGAARFNASEAARIAGYSERSATSIGHENLRKPDVAAEIERRVSEQAMGEQELLIELGAQARLDLGQFMVVRAGGGAAIDLKKMIEAGLGRFIKSITPTKWGDKVEFHDPFAAKQLIARLLERAPKGTEDDPVHQVSMSLAEWRAERAKRHEQLDHTMAAFEDEGGDE